MNRIMRNMPRVLRLLDVLRLTEPRGLQVASTSQRDGRTSGLCALRTVKRRERRAPASWQFTVAGACAFFTKRTQFLQKTIWPQLATNMDVVEIVLCKSVGFLYTKRTQFLGAKFEDENENEAPTSPGNDGAAGEEELKRESGNIELEHAGRMPAPLSLCIALDSIARAALKRPQSRRCRDFCVFSHCAVRPLRRAGGKGVNDGAGVFRTVRRREGRAPDRNFLEKKHGPAILGYILPKNGGLCACDLNTFLP
jgi:hypothetical protein